MSPKRFAALAVSAVALAAAQPLHAEPTEAETARLEELKAAADAIDPAGENAANTAAWQVARDYALSIYPEDHPEVILVDAELATAQYFRGDVAGATARIEAALAALEGAGETYEPDRMSFRNALVVFYMRTGRHGEALAMAEQVLAQRRTALEEAPGDFARQRQFGAALNNAANAANETGDYDRAVALIDEAVAFAPTMAEPLPGSIQWYSNRAAFLGRAGRPEAAFAAAREAVAAGQALLPPTHPYQALLYNTLGTIAGRRGLLADAEAAQRRALKIAESGPDPVQAAQYQMTLAQVLLERGAATEALTLAETSAATLTEKVGADGDLAMLAESVATEARMQLGQLEEAGDRVTAVLLRQRRVNEPGHRDRLAATDLAARIAERSGEIDRAYALYHEGQAARRDVFPERNAARLAGEARLGLLAAKAGLADGRWALAAGDGLAALRSEMAAAGQLSGTDFLDINAGLAWALEAALETGDADAIYTAAGRLLPTRADRAARAAHERSQLGAEERASLRADQDRRERLLRLSRVYLAELGAGAKPERLASLRDDIAALEAELKNSGARIVAERERDLADLQAALGADEAVLLAVPAVDRTAVLVVRSDAVTAHAAPLSARDGAEAVADVRSALGVDGAARGVLVSRTASTEPAYDFTAGARVHDALFAGDVPNALEGAAHVHIAAGGALSRLPFAMLAARPDSGRLADADWLVRRFSLSTLASLSEGARPQGRAALAGRVLAVGAPDFDDLGGTHEAGTTDVALLRSARVAVLEGLPPLPAAAAELDAIAAAVSAEDRILLTGPDAEERGVLAALARPADVVAFATHGLLEGEVAGLAEPALALTRTDGDDGFLTASEIAGVDMDAEWVILSACNTGGPDRADAAGLTGLASAFLYAGARNLLVSHWQVADDVAAALTVPTVEGALGGGTGGAEALRQAMLALIDGPDARRQHPALWAPFVHVGAGIGD